MPRERKRPRAKKKGEVRPCHCPLCGADFHDGDIPIESILNGFHAEFCGACGRKNHWSSCIGRVDPDRDRVVEWFCPHCEGSWPRD